jgi:hypothetical protein
MPAASTENEQVIEAVVSGPDGANRLYICTGQALLPIWLGSNQNVAQTWTFLIGPALPHPQFHRATASAFVTAYGTYDAYVADPMMAGSWRSLDFRSVEADWDDESGKTEMRVEVALSTGSSANFSLTKIGYSATILAELPAA